MVAASSKMSIHSLESDDEEEKLHSLEAAEPGPVINDAYIQQLTFLCIKKCKCCKHGQHMLQYVYT